MKVKSLTESDILTALRFGTVLLFRLSLHCLVVIEIWWTSHKNPLRKPIVQELTLPLIGEIRKQNRSQNLHHNANFMFLFSYLQIRSNRTATIIKQLSAFLFLNSNACILGTEIFVYILWLISIVDERFKYQLAVRAHAQGLIFIMRLSSISNH